MFTCIIYVCTKFSTGTKQSNVLLQQFRAGVLWYIAFEQDTHSPPHFWLMAIGSLSYSKNYSNRKDKESGEKEEKARALMVFSPFLARHLLFLSPNLLWRLSEATHKKGMCAVAWLNDRNAFFALSPSRCRTHAGKDPHTLEAGCQANSTRVQRCRSDSTDLEISSSEEVCCLVFFINFIASHLSSSLVTIFRSDSHFPSQTRRPFGIEDNVAPWHLSP